MVVEKEQYENYLEYVDRDKLLILPKKYLEEYDTFWKDEDRRKGSGPARNFVWDHSTESGAKRHWIMDDNIEGFHRLNRNIKALVTSGTIFKIMEDFVDRYKNVYIAGPNYQNFIRRSEKVSYPFILNTRIYSCLLIQNDIPYRWRGRYNEDTDLCLRVLKDGHCTIQFNAFLQGKVTTQRMKGGNMEIYKEGTLQKSKMLAEMHPDVAKVVWRFNRWHHLVDYSRFKRNQLVKLDGLDVPKGINNYGMILK
tara:strand:- start:417 stop:1172 length:756 start_codon:yes stop_codon:yes gene_type:complete